MGLSVGSAPPSFTTSCLCVPILNLCVKWLDRLSEAIENRFRLWGATWKLSPRATNFAAMVVWASLFMVMTSTGFLAKGRDFPGGRLEFWQSACEQNKWKACKTYVRVLNYVCEDGSREACFTYGQVTDEGRLMPRKPVAAGESFGRACDMGLSQGCGSLIQFAQRRRQGRVPQGMRRWPRRELLPPRHAVQQWPGCPARRSAGVQFVPEVLRPRMVARVRSSGRELFGRTGNRSRSGEGRWRISTRAATAATQQVAFKWPGYTSVA